MKRFILYVCLVALLTGGVFSVSVPSAQAVTVEELQAQIQALLAQIAQLQLKISQLGGGSAQWCHNFNINLRVGDTGNDFNSDVSALQVALTKEGFFRSKAAGPFEFDELTASGVVGFQEKYKAEILTPLGLVRGTGYVGSATRAKLNTLYGCGVIRPIPIPVPDRGLILSVGKIIVDGSAIKIPLSWSASSFEGTLKYNVYQRHSQNQEYGAAIAGVGGLSYTATASAAEDNYFIVKACGVTSCYSSNEVVVHTLGSPASIILLSPNGGEKLERGKNYTVRWQDNSNYEKVELKLFTFSSVSNIIKGAFPTSIPNTGSYEWTIPATLPLGDSYKVEVVRCLKLDVNGNCLFQALSRGDSDMSDNYFSIGSAGISSIAILSPNGGEKWIAGKNYPVRWAGMRYEKGIDVNFVLIDSIGTGIYQLGLVSVSSIVDSTGDKNEAVVMVPAFLPASSYRLQMTMISNGARVYDNSDGDIAVVKETVTPSITVLSPNGGETFVQEGTYNIKLLCQGISKVIDISLVAYTSEGAPLGETEIARQVTCRLGATSEYSWKVHSVAGTGSKFKVAAHVFDDVSIIDQSDNYFSIIPAPQVLPPIGDVNQSGTVGIEDSLFIAQYVAGSRILTSDQLKLADVNSDGKVSTNDANIIAVYLVGLLPKLPVSLKVGDVKEDGMVDIADSLFIAQYEADSRTLTQIQLAMADVNNDSKVTKADADTIANYLVGNIKELPFPAAPFVPVPPPPPALPSITVLSPNGGETLEIGKTYTISWKSSNLTIDKLPLGLEDDNTPGIRTVFSIAVVPSSTREYVWTVGQLQGGNKIVPGNKYKIHLNGSTVGDESNNYFSIVASPTQP